MEGGGGFSGMVNLPDSLYDEPSASYSSGAVAVAVAAAAAAAGGRRGPFYNGVELKSLSVEELIVGLNDVLFRETALDLLSKKRETCDQMGNLLWHSFGTIATLLKEIVDVYKLLSTPNLTDRHTNRVCNALALLQSVASHPDTRILFIKARIPSYLYPLFNTTIQDKPHEYLRLISLGVIGSLAKTNDKEVAHFLIETEVLPFCIRCMHVGRQLSKTVATLIIHRILIHDEGLRYCCCFAERFFAICDALNMMLETQNPLSVDLLKQIICCYHKLSENPRGCECLQTILPHKLRGPAISNTLRNEPTAQLWLQNLFRNIAVGFRSRTQSER